MGIFSGLLAAFAFGTVWGWIILVAAFIVITALVENEKGFWAFFTLGFTVIALYQVKLGEFGHFIIINPGKVVLMVLGYFAVGTVWGVIKWFLFVTQQLEKYNEVKSAWLQNQVLKTIETPEQAMNFKKSLCFSGVGIAPKAGSHKSDIMLWMTYWPFSGVWTLINDPIRRVFRFIYTHIATTLQSISDRMFKEAMADMALAKEAEEEAERVKRDADSRNRR